MTVNIFHASEIPKWHVTYKEEMKKKDFIRSSTQSPVQTGNFAFMSENCIFSNVIQEVCHNQQNKQMPSSHLLFRMIEKYKERRVCLVVTIKTFSSEVLKETVPDFD